MTHPDCKPKADRVYSLALENYLTGNLPISDYESVISDVLADIMHYCDQRGWDFQHELQRAQSHFEWEKENGNDC